MSHAFGPSGVPGCVLVLQPHLMVRVRVFAQEDLITGQQQHASLVNLEKSYLDDTLRDL